DSTRYARSGQTPTGTVPGSRPYLWRRAGRRMPVAAVLPSPATFGPGEERPAQASAGPRLLRLHWFPQGNVPPFALRHPLHRGVAVPRSERENPGWAFPTEAGRPPIYRPVGAARQSDRPDCSHPAEGLPTVVAVARSGPQSSERSCGRWLLGLVS